VTASAGAGDVSLPSYASLGPIVDYFTQKPSETAGGSASFTLGSDALKRGFLRLESGKVGPLSGYVSGSWIKGDLWRGPGTIDRKHYEGKLRYDLPNGGDHQLPDRPQRLLRLRQPLDHQGCSTPARPMTRSAARVATSPIWAMCRRPGAGDRHRPRRQRDRPALFQR
jgi:hypothetical protein